MIKHMHLLYLSDMSTNMLLACISFLQALELWIWPVRPNHLVGRSWCGTCQPGSPGFAIERFSSQISHTNRNKWPKSPLTGKNQHVQHTHSQVTPKPERNASQENYLQSHWIWWFHACWRESKKGDAGARRPKAHCLLHAARSTIHKSLWRIHQCPISEADLKLHTCWGSNG